MTQLRHTFQPQHHLSIPCIPPPPCQNSLHSAALQCHQPRDGVTPRGGRLPPDSGRADALGQNHRRRPLRLCQGGVGPRLMGVGGDGEHWQVVGDRLKMVGLNSVSTGGASTEPPQSVTVPKFPNSDIPSIFTPTQLVSNTFCRFLSHSLYSSPPPPPHTHAHQC